MYNKYKEYFIATKFPFRLLLLGVYKNLLNEMEADGVKPDIRTYTQLLNVMPSTESAEKV